MRVRLRRGVARIRNVPSQPGPLGLPAPQPVEEGTRGGSVKQVRLRRGDARRSPVLSPCGLHGQPAVRRVEEDNRPELMERGLRGEIVTGISVPIEVSIFYSLILNVVVAP